jgi:hypothetical protein
MGRRTLRSTGYFEGVPSEARLRAGPVFDQVSLGDFSAISHFNPLLIDRRYLHPSYTRDKIDTE